MQVNPRYERYRVSRAQVNEDGSGTQNYSPYQSEPMENVSYWYDGNVPYCADATAWQPLDDNFVHMNVPGYFHVDNYGVLIHQLVNVRRNSHVGFQESVSHSYHAPQYWDSPYTNPPNRTRVFSNPVSPCSSATSPCTSLSSIAWDDSLPSPTPHSQHHSHSDDAAVSGTHLSLNAPHPGPPSVSASAAPSPTLHSPLSRQHPDNVISESQLQLIPPPDPPSIPQMASPVYAQSQQQQQQQQQQQKEDQDQPPPSSPAPTTPPSGTSSPALDLTSQDVVGRRASAPKRRRIRRAVQPLACYFCRGRKIACGPPRSGDKTCEPCERRQLVCEYPAESYRGRRSSGRKAATCRATLLEVLQNANST